MIIEYITAINKGFKTQVRNQEQYCKVCDRVFYKERWGKYCSDVCFRIFKNSKVRNIKINLIININIFI